LDRVRPLRASLTRGNGTPEPDADRLARLEQVIEDMQQTLDTQFRRMADMQAEIDALRTKPHVG
jgi:hypothetical protein